MNTIGPLDTLWQDLRYAARLLRRDKGFAAAAILSLALGIGANTAIFQLLDAVRLRSLRSSDPQRARRDPHRGRASRDRQLHRPPADAHLPAVGADPRAAAGVLAAVRLEQRAASTPSPAAKCSFAKALWSAATSSATLGVQPRVGRAARAGRRHARAAAPRAP